MDEDTELFKVRIVQITLLIIQQVMELNVLVLIIRKCFCTKVVWILLYNWLWLPSIFKKVVTKKVFADFECQRTTPNCTTVL